VIRVSALNMWIMDEIGFIGIVKNRRNRSYFNLTFLNWGKMETLSGWNSYAVGAQEFLSSLAD
jgi:hypothetical protein